jgi:hypothetical protein
MRYKNLVCVIVMLFNMLIAPSTYSQTENQPVTPQTETQPATPQTENQPATAQTKTQSATKIPLNLENCVPVDFNIGMTFQAKFPDKTGKYYMIPAEVIDALLDAISKGTVINIDKQPVCEPETE